MDRNWAILVAVEDEVSAALACSRSKLPAVSGTAASVIVSGVRVWVWARERTWSGGRNPQRCYADGPVLFGR